MTEVAAKLKSSDLQLGKVTYQLSSSVAAGKVISQSLYRGKTVPAGLTKIDLVISQGSGITKPPVTNPPVTTQNPAPNTEALTPGTQVPAPEPETPAPETGVTTTVTDQPTPMPEPYLNEP